MHPASTASSAEKILIIDDDRMVTALVAKALCERGYKVSCCHESGRYAEYVEGEKPALIILDVHMPGMDGFEVLRELRRGGSGPSIPVLMLTDRSDVGDRILGLDTGADDYLSKPFEIMELAARVRALLRRVQRGAELMEVRRTLGDLTIDFASATAFRDGKLIPLSRMEYTLLAILAREPGRTFDKEELLRGVWGDAYVEDPFLLKSHIRYLRRKVERDPKNPEHIVTIHRRGYQLR